MLSDKDTDRQTDRHTDRHTDTQRGGERSSEYSGHDENVLYVQAAVLQVSCDITDEMSVDPGSEVKSVQTHKPSVADH